MSKAGQDMIYRAVSIPFVVAYPIGYVIPLQVWQRTIEADNVLKNTAPLYRLVMGRETLGVSLCLLHTIRLTTFTLWRTCYRPSVPSPSYSL